MSESFLNKSCYSCGVSLEEEIQMFGFFPKKEIPPCTLDECISIDNLQPCCAICYQIYKIEQDILLLKFFLKDRTRLVNVNN